MSSAESDAPVPRFLRGVTILECAVVAWAAFLLFFLPGLARTTWAWSPPPFNSRYVGAVYFAALVPLMIAAISGRWAPGRIVLLMIFTFTTSIMVVMFFYTNTFVWTRVQTYGFWALYLFLPFDSAVFLCHYRRMLAPRSKNPATIVIAALLAIYGVGLLAAPTTFTSFWPWAVDPFHARIYAATFLTPAVGLWFATPAGKPSERATVGISLAILGAVAIAGLLIGDATVPAAHRVNFAAAGTWGFIALNVVLAAIGVSLALDLPARLGRRPATTS